VPKSTSELLKVIGYTRVSTAEQASEGLSLDAQEARIRAWCEASGAELVEVVREEGVSGTKLLAERPGGRHIAHLLDSRRPKADAVVVVRMDRLGRDAAEQIALLKRFRSGKVGLVAIAQQIDLATPHGRAMAQIGAVFNELERALIAERTTEALAELRSQGKAWNHAPFGWRAVDGHLERDDDEQLTIVRATQLRTTGLGYLKIAQALNAEGRATKRGGAWQAMSVRSVLLSAAKMAAASFGM
jgi:DNA invertase Pin-like site-specific DNA recombinase